jgi:hypothetical protein
MKTVINRLLRGGLPAAVALIGITSSTLQAQTLVHRYEFNGNVNDSVGSQNGTASTNTTWLEAPSFGSIVPTGASGPTQSIQFGMNDGTKKSFFSANAAIIQNQASAGSVAMFINSNATTSTLFRYAFSALNLPVGFALGQITLSSNQSLTAGVNGSNLGSVTLTPDTWYHVALTWQQTGGNLTRTYYVDGNQVATATTTGSLTGVTAVRVGTFNTADDGANLANQFDGRLYDLQVYSGALSSAQVSSLYTNPGAAIPEPSTWALLAASVIALIVFRRRRSKC